MYLRSIENLTVAFKKDLSNVEIYGIERIIDLLNEEEILFYSKEDLGLAYTSSSEYGMYNICNGHFFYNDDLMSHFSITENNMLILVCFDDDENYKHYEVCYGWSYV